MVNGEMIGYVTFTEEIMEKKKNKYRNTEI